MRTLHAWGAGKVYQKFQIGFGSGFSGVWSCLLSVELVGIMMLFLSLDVHGRKCFTWFLCEHVYYLDITMDGFSGDDDGRGCFFTISKLFCVCFLKQERGSVLDYAFCD